MTGPSLPLPLPRTICSCASPEALGIVYRSQTEQPGTGLAILRLKMFSSGITVRLEL